MTSCHDEIEAGMTVIVTDASGNNGDDHDTAACRGCSEPERCGVHRGDPCPGWRWFS